jgi:rfaE bifunctional protein kinase chain/domain
MNAELEAAEVSDLRYILQHEIGKSRVLVVGDPIMDVYHHGEVTKLSQEAPVPVFVETHREIRDGGALNVVRNLEALQVPLDVWMPRGARTKKHRYLVGHQQIFRTDNDVEHEPLQVLEGLMTKMDACTVAVLSDYGKGSLSPEFCELFIGSMRARHKHVIVDPRGGDWDKYSGATVICPNENEWMAHCAIKTGTQPVFAYTLLKLGAGGMQLGVDGVRKESDIVWRSHTRARQVFDVTGAGDTVIATFAAAAGFAGHDLRKAAMLANMAAGVVVGKLGTSTCSREELLQEIERG